MGAPPGNKYAFGNKGGRPRDVSFPPEIMMQLGEEMIAYVKEKKHNVLHLSEWYTIEKGFTYNEWKTFIQRNEFIPYYEQALKIVGRKYLDKSSSIRDGISQRWLRSYFPDLVDRENLEMDQEAARSAQNNISATPEQLQKMEEFQAQLSTVSDALNSSRNNNNKDV